LSGAFYAVRPKPPLRWILKRYGWCSIGQSCREHSSQPFFSRAAWRETPCSIADLIFWQRSTDWRRGAFPQSA
jgi:hypothetical protein